MKSELRAHDEAPPLVAEVIDAHQSERGGLLELLVDLQARAGHLDPAWFPAIAEALNLSSAEVHGVVTYYSDLHTTPSGRHELALCRAEACQAVGADRLAGVAERLCGAAFGETTPDGALSLRERFCLGNCSLGPSALFDGRLVGRLDEARLAGLVDEARSDGP